MMNDPDLLSPARCRELFAMVESAARSLGIQDVEVILGASEEALTRFANNAIHQNVAERGAWLSVRVLEDGRTARASTNRLDAASIARAAGEAAAIARAQAPDDELLPLFEPAPVPSLDRYAEATAAVSPDTRARAVRDAIAVAEEAGQNAAGIFSTSRHVEALLNSRGVFCHHAGTIATFSITAMASGSSGWAKASAVDARHIDPLALARRAVGKARLSRAPREIPPGRYPVILEAAAVLDLAGQMFCDFSATAMEDQRSFLTGRMGEQLFGANIHIEDDAAHPLQSGPAFDGEGVPRRRLLMVDAGVPRTLAKCRRAAHILGVEPTGHGLPLPNEQGEMPTNIVIKGGETPIEDMVASMPRGILVTRLWYIREVDPYEKIMTGMTRDGTFLVENGEIVCGLKNFRFNQSIIGMLNQVERMSEPVRASGEETFDMVVPAMQVREFHFTETTQY